MRAKSVVSHQEWVAARKKLIEQEKDLTRRRDSLSKARRELPWERVEKPYAFQTPNGAATLAGLFEGRSQLIVYHFMLGPGWEEGCKSCSFLADHFEPAVVHLNQRGVSMTAISKAPLTEIEAFKKRMGWTFNWASSNECDFNEDYHVTFTQDELDSGGVYYNYERTAFPSTEAPGVSVFCAGDDGSVYHTYSAYQRGLDNFITAYQYLDIVPSGRNEEGLSFPMEWVRLHDAYA